MAKEFEENEKIIISSNEDTNVEIDPGSNTNAKKEATE